MEVECVACVGEGVAECDYFGEAGELQETEEV